MFPIDIRLKKRFYIQDSELEKNIEILEFFKQEFINRKADNVRIENNEVRFNNKFFKFGNNWNIMVPVDRGILSIRKDRRSEIEIEYLFSLKVTLIVGAIAGIIFGLFSKMWFVGLEAFLWLGGMNWLVALIRHSIMFGNLTRRIKEKILK